MSARIGEPDIEPIIDAAEAHGRKSEPDHEVGDLQEIVRALWVHLTPRQRAVFCREWEDFVGQWLE